MPISPWSRKSGRLASSHSLSSARNASSSASYAKSTGRTLGRGGEAPHAAVVGQRIEVGQVLVDTHAHVYGLAADRGRAGRRKVERLHAQRHARVTVEHEQRVRHGVA